MLLVLEAFLGGLQLLLPQPVSFDELSVEAALLLLVDHIVGVVVDVFVLLDLLRVVDDHVRLEVELGSVEGDVLALLHRILEVFLHLVFEVAGDWVMVEVLPLYSLARVDSEHPLYHILRNL